MTDPVLLAYAERLTRRAAKVRALITPQPDPQADEQPRTPVEALTPGALFGPPPPSPDPIRALFEDLR